MKLSLSFRCSFYDSPIGAIYAKHSAGLINRFKYEKKNIVDHMFIFFIKPNLINIPRRMKTKQKKAWPHVYPKIFKICWNMLVADRWIDYDHQPAQKSGLCYYLVKQIWELCYFILFTRRLIDDKWRGSKSIILSSTPDRSRASSTDRCWLLFCVFGIFWGRRKRWSPDD